MLLASTICRGQRSQRGNRLHRPGEGVYEGTTAVLCLRAQEPVTVAGSQGFRGGSYRFLPALWPLNPLVHVLPRAYCERPSRRAAHDELAPPCQNLNRLNPGFVDVELAPYRVAVHHCNGGAVTGR